MPLYACDSCGFTSAAFRVDAARAHVQEYPECPGSIKIIFRSGERYRGSEHSRRGVHASGVDNAHIQTSPAGHAEPFRMRQRPRADGTLMLTLLGDLDFAASDGLGERLHSLKATGRAVTLDLSQVEFIDSSGVQALLIALVDARWSGWQLEVSRDLSPSVQRAARIAGIARVFWPEDQPTSAPASRGEAPPES